jgi:hypothetical protein
MEKYGMCEKGNLKMKKRSGKLAVARRMPHLRHSIDGEIFKIQNSEVARWLCSQPEIMQYVFDHYKTELVFDSDSMTWRGKDNAD